MNKDYKKFNNEQMFIITKKAIPNVLLNVLKAKDLIKNDNISITNAVNKVGISRTTYYKYNNEVFYFNNHSNNKVITIDLDTIDKVGLLSEITSIISKNNFNILTINQFPPKGKNNKITFSTIMSDETSNITKLVEGLKKIKNVNNVKIKSIEKENER